MSEEKNRAYLGNNLRYLRKKRGLSQQKLADTLGLRRNNIASYETGAVDPHPISLLQLARFFSIPPLRLFSENLLLPPAADPSDQQHILDQPESPHEGLRLLQQKTEALQKILDGFQVFHELKKQEFDLSIPETQALNNDYETLMDILGALLENNRVFLKEMGSMKPEDEKPSL